MKNWDPGNAEGTGNMARPELSMEVADPYSREADALVHFMNATDIDFRHDHYRKWDSDLRQRVRDRLPLRLGKPFVTDAGELPFKTLVHVAVQTAPEAPTTEENIQSGLRSALVTVDQEGSASVVLPRVLPPSSKQDVQYPSLAEVVLTDLLQYPPRHLRKLLLVDRDEEWIRWLEDQLPRVEEKLDRI